MTFISCDYLMSTLSFLQEPLRQYRKKYCVLDIFFYIYIYLYLFIYSSILSYPLELKDFRSALSEPSEISLQWPCYSCAQHILTWTRSIKHEPDLIAQTGILPYCNLLLCNIQWRTYTVNLYSLIRALRPTMAYRSFLTMFYSLSCRNLD